MTRRGTMFGFVLLLVIASALGYAVWKLRTASTVQICNVCTRPLHERSRTVAVIDGKRQVFCCPACALTTHRQTSKRVQVVELTDYETDAPLDPGAAYIVEGSAVNLCVHQHMLFDQNKQPSALDFDRCSPSMIAFSGKDAADLFARQHGGVVRRFQEVVSEWLE